MMDFPLMAAGVPLFHGEARDQSTYCFIYMYVHIYLCICIHIYVYIHLHIYNEVSTYGGRCTGSSWRGTRVTSTLSTSWPSATTTSKCSTVQSALYIYIHIHLYIYVYRYIHIYICIKPK